MVTCQVNGVMLGTERFGDRSAPLILCVGGPTMPQSSPAGSALTLVGTRPVAPGPADHDLPEHGEAAMRRLSQRPLPDWSDREAVAD